MCGDKVVCMYVGAYGSSHVDESAIFLSIYVCDYLLIFSSLSQISSHVNIMSALV